MTIEEEEKRMKKKVGAKRSLHEKKTGFCSLHVAREEREKRKQLQQT